MWDGRDAHGRPVASGVYLIRLRADHFVQARKALLFGKVGPLGRRYLKVCHRRALAGFMLNSK